ncbi:uncharacterized protein LOC119398957 [Rhipicephalus sanguineus]|uniref:uncharacterized protein LOC119398957 n=1 Tax=Rhipicephalus sanguineus TaxID=34632 RepID=UPI0020C4CD83|nr:uncharacterized protein LOC119398957 [Rhipicephalus sanguineus]
MGDGPEEQVPTTQEKKLQNCSEEMLIRKKRCLPKQMQAPSEEVANNKLCRLFDCSHLTTYGETVESLQIHNERLQNNAACHDKATGRPRLRATALDRHKELRSLTLSDALLLFPFLGTEALEQALLTPCLVEKEGLTLHIDGEPVLSVPSLLAGMACLFPSFWVGYLL